MHRSTKHIILTMRIHMPILHLAMAHLQGMVILALLRITHLRTVLLCRHQTMVLHRAGLGLLRAGKVLLLITRQLAEAAPG